MIGWQNELWNALGIENVIDLHRSSDGRQYQSGARDQFSFSMRIDCLCSEAKNFALFIPLDRKRILSVQFVCDRIDWLGNGEVVLDDVRRKKCDIPWPTKAFLAIVESLEMLQVFVLSRILIEKVFQPFRDTL